MDWQPMKTGFLHSKYFNKTFDLRIKKIISTDFAHSKDKKSLFVSSKFRLYSYKKRDIKSVRKLIPLKSATTTMSPFYTYPKKRAPTLG
jgi:hypothetical protein